MVESRQIYNELLDGARFNNEEMIAEAFEKIDGDLKLDATMIFEAAVYSGNPEITAQLIQSGLEPQPKNLLLACELGEAQIAQQFINAGVDGNYNESEPLEKACRSGNAKAVECLLVAGSKITQDAFYNACSYCDIDTVTMLVKNGADVETEFFGGYSHPLKAAILNENWEVAHELLDLGANGPFMLKEHELLLPVLESGQVHLAQRLIDEQDLSLDGRYDRPNAQEPTTVRDMINLQDANGNSMLHRAIANEENSLAQFLITNKADISLRNNDGQLPVDVAFARKNIDIVESIVHRMETICAEQHQVIEQPKGRER